MLIRKFFLVAISILTSCNFVNVIELPSVGKRADRTVHIVPGPSSVENILKIKYQYLNSNDCPQGAFALVEYQKRLIRANLFPDLKHVEVALGASPVQDEKAQVHVIENNSCKIDKFETDVVSSTTHTSASTHNSYDYLARIHSPYIVVRPNQIVNPYTDVPLGMAYSVIKQPQSPNTTIRYTVFFSDEDSLSSSLETDVQMAKYGRRTDIEWVYEVEIDPNQKVVRRQYQGGYFLGMGHRTLDFKGRFLANSEHPILYDIADHNVFSDSKRFGLSRAPLQGYHFVPIAEIKTPEAREWVLFNNPWMLRLSDYELQKEKKLSVPATDYLYVLVDGALTSGSFTGQVTFGKLSRGIAQQDAAAEVGNLSGGGRSYIEGLGQDLWHQQSFTAIPLGSENLHAISKSVKHGVFNFVKAVSVTNLELNKLRFFRIKNEQNRYQIEDITHFFKCNIAGINTSCSF